MNANKMCWIFGKINKMNNIWVKKLQCRTNSQIDCVEASNCFCKNICGINFSSQKYNAIRLYHQLQSKQTYDIIWLEADLYLQKYKRAVKVFSEMALIQYM